MEFSYSLDDFGTMTIWANDCTVAEVSDCGKMSPKELTQLMYDVLYEQGYNV